MKRNVTKILSILCLVAVLACGFVPCITLSGEYMQLLSGITGVSEAIPEENMTTIEQMLETQGITIDLKASMDALTNLAVPLADGEISIVDFYTLSGNCEAVATQLGTLPIDGLGIPTDTEDPVQQALLPVSEMISSLAALGQTMSLVSYVFLIPVGLFGLFAFFVALRIILRILGRRGLGVGITLLAILNAALMIGIPYGVEMAAAEGLPISAEATYVPYVLVGSCLASCIIWAIGRGAKVKKVKEEVIVETPVVAPAETPVESEVAPVELAVSTEEVVVEESVEEENAEELEEAVVDTELVEEVLGEEE